MLEQKNSRGGGKKKKKEHRDRNYREQDKKSNRVYAQNKQKQPYI